MSLGGSYVGDEKISEKISLSLLNNANTYNCSSMNPPYFGFFDMGSESEAVTFDECLKEFDGNIEFSFRPIAEFIEDYHSEDNCDAFLEGADFRFFYPENEEHHFYIFCGRPNVDTFTLTNGQQYYCGEYNDCIFPVMENENDYDEDDPYIRLVDVIESEYEHLISQYGHLFKKLTIEEFQEYLINDYPLVVCAK